MTGCPEAWRGHMTKPRSSVKETKDEGSAERMTVSSNGLSSTRQGEHGSEAITDRDNAARHSNEITVAVLSSMQHCQRLSMTYNEWQVAWEPAAKTNTKQID